MDFRFNQLRSVQKVDWKEDNVPWYCEVRDGFSWFGYCKNKACKSYKQLFIVNRGYGIFKLQ